MGSRGVIESTAGICSCLRPCAANYLPLYTFPKPEHHGGHFLPPHATSVKRSGSDAQEYQHGEAQVASRPVSFGNSQPPRRVTRTMERAHLPTKSTAAPLGEVIPCVGEWKKGDPRTEKHKRATPAALQRNTVTSWAASGIMGRESENEGVRVER